MVKSIAEICEDDSNKAVVEESDGYIFYQLVFMLAYGVVCLLCSYMLGSEWKKAQKVTINNNRYQVVLCLAVGSFIRIFSFLEVNCVYEEVFRSLKDVFFVMAFVLVVLFWIELQTGMRAMKSIQRLRPYLIAVMVIYAIFRILASIADLFISGGVKNMFMGVCILIYGSIMALGLWFGVQLLGKMKTMKRSDIQARLQKLTRFIILENLVLVVFLFAYLIRTVVFKKAKEDDPWLWFYLKLIEKVLEFFAICILCMTMTTKAKAKAKKPDAAANRRRTSAADSARRNRAKKGASSRKAAADGVAMQSMEGAWVETKDANGHPYFFNEKSKKSVWTLPKSNAKRISLVEYKRAQAKAKGVPMQDVEEGSINPLSAEIKVPPPPSGSPPQAAAAAPASADGAIHV